MRAFWTRERGDGVTRSRPALHRSHRRSRLPLLSAGVLLLGCVQQDGAVSTFEAAEATEREDIEIVSLTQISGTVNGASVDASVSATIHTGRGGISTCRFAKLPDLFNPGTFGTHT